ncbi:hypothetical protein [Paenibacillus sp. GCM10028914]|uniref:prenylated flavin chaperone LpdD n=1 Tax=Paenibacillus sp. GCM10028914 TaxID=3273416 RepID=UPI00360A1C0E
MTANYAEALTLEEIEVGRDKLIIIKGGEAHIGAVSTAYLVHNNPIRVKVETMSVPGHKEHLLTEKFARQCAEHLCQTVTVVMGIHFDHLQRSEIDQIVSLTESMVASFLEGKV